MAPVWLTVLAWTYLAVCFGCSAIIAGDVTLGGRRQPMGVMNFVFPITALYLGPFALAFYWRWARAPAGGTRAAMAMGETGVPEAAMAAAGEGRPAPGQVPAHEMAGTGGMGGMGGMGEAGRSRERRPYWVMMAIEVSHCGSGCALGDLIAEFAVFWLALSVAGLTLGAEYLGDYILALAFGIVFQYFAIAPMRGLGVRDGLVAAAKADFISLTAFEIGLFGWMAIMAFVLFPAPGELMPSSAAFWLLMQVGMIVGFATSWPANVWLVRRGIKVPM
jgi:hypothetical protein